MRYILYFLFITSLCLNNALGQQPKLMLPIGHTSLIHSKQMSPNGKYILTVSADGKAIIWDTKTGKVLHESKYSNYKDDNMLISNEGFFSADCRFFYTISEENVKKWSVRTGKLIGVEFKLDKGAHFWGHAINGEGNRIVLWDEINFYDVNLKSKKTTKIPIPIEKSPWEIKVYFLPKTDKVLIKDLKGHKKPILLCLDLNTFNIDYEIYEGQIENNLGLDSLVNVIQYSVGRDTLYVRNALSGDIRFKISSDNIVFPTIDAKHVISLSKNGNVKIFDTVSGSVISDTVFNGIKKTSPIIGGIKPYLIIVGGIENKLLIWNSLTKKYTINNGDDLDQFLEEDLAISSSEKYFGGTFKGKSWSVNSSFWNLTGDKIIISTGDGGVRTWNNNTNCIEKNFYHDYITSLLSDIDIKAKFIPNQNKLLIYSRRDEKVYLHGSNDGKLISKLGWLHMGAFSVSSNNKGTLLLCTSRGAVPYCQILDIATNKVIWYFSAYSIPNTSLYPSDFLLAKFSLDEKSVIIIDENYKSYVIDISSSKIIRSEIDFGRDFVFDSKRQYIYTLKNTIEVTNLKSGQVKSLSIKTENVTMIDYNPLTHTILGTLNDHTCKFWNAETGQEIATLISIDSTDWIVKTPSGLFDASEGAMKLMHYVVNDSTDTDDPWKVIELENLKQRYYQPGLLPILLGYRQEKLREVPAFESVALPPKIALSLSHDKMLRVQLNNQKGGIGKVSVYLNNIEIVEELRVKPGRDSIQKTLELRLSLLPYSRFFDTLNVLKVVAYNGQNWIRSRPDTLHFAGDKSKGLPTGQSEGVAKTAADVSLYGVVVGTNNIGLRYAAKDAQDFENALKLSAKSLFGATRTNIQLLTTTIDRQQSTKTNILEAFKAAQQSRPQDIFVLYLSGHGVNYGGQDGDFYYLTAGATAADATYLNDPVIRQNYALSSDEITDLLNKIPARKKVLILDACAAGKGAEKTFLTMREIPASQVRALDRLQDRTGFYVLAGSASDAVSYETGVYGQGLLTYSLLKAIKGAALRQDGAEEYVDVQKLLNYAVEEVPKLAVGIGGIQQPFYRSPSEQKSFDIGKITPETKRQIVLAEPKPVFMSATFQDKEQEFDVLELSEKVNSMLSELSAKGSGSNLIFTEAKDYPDAYKLSGSYVVANETVTVSCNIIKNNKPVSGKFSITGRRTELEVLVNQVLTKAQQVVNGQK